MKKGNIRKLFSNKFGIKKLVSFVILGSLTLSLTSCGDNSTDASASSDGKLQVVTTIFPEYDWVREIVGQGENSIDKSAADKVDVSMLLDNGVDLHSFQPTAADIAKISTCDVFIYVGGESDAWVDDALKEKKNEDMVIIDLLDVLGESVKEEEVVEGMQGEEEEEDDVDSHDGDAESESEEENSDEEEKEYDEHVWLSLRDSEILVQKIEGVLSEKDPSSADAFKANADEYIGKLDALDKQYQSAVDNGTVDTILFGDRFPFRYMVDDYGIKYYAAFVGCSAETEASFETVIFLAGKVDELGLPSICTIEKSDQKIAETVKNNTKTQDQEILTMDSLQSVTSADVASGDTYLKKMTDNLKVLKTALNSK